MSERSGGDLPQALVVDDEREVADAYALRLRGLCDVDVAYSGSGALDTVEDHEVDVVLLDRHMPGMSGDDVLNELDEHGFGGRVLMVTAIDPGFDILDMPFDDYLCKPVDKEDLRAAVTQQCRILGYEELGEYFGIESKRQVIEAELSAGELDAHDEYQRIRSQSKRLFRRAERLLDDPSEALDEFEDVNRENR